MFGYDHEEELKREFAEDLSIGGGSLGGEMYEEFVHSLEHAKQNENIDFVDLTVQDIKRMVNELSR